MKPSDWFIVGLRLFGVSLFIQFFSEMVAYVQVNSGMITLVRTSSNSYLFHAAVELILSLIFLLFAPVLTSFLDWRSGESTAGGRPCTQCGYDLRAGHARCPECGATPRAEGDDAKEG